MSAGRLYAAALRAFPAEVRRELGAAMAETFEAALSTRRGPVARLGFVLGELYDVVWAGLALRSRGRRGRAVIRRGRFAGAVRDDAVYALRSVWRNRAFFLFAALTLALGVGASTAIFSSLKSVVLEPLPFPGGERVVLPWRTAGPSMFLMPEAEHIEAVGEQRDIFEAVATFGNATKVLTGAGEPVLVDGTMMSGEMAAFMGMRPALGRLFTEEELAGDGARVLLLSYGLWKQRFGGSASVLGGTVQLNGEPWTIIGVMPRDAVKPNGTATPADIWMPLPATSPGYQVIARLRPGVTLAAASERMDAIVKRSAEAGPMGGTVTPATMMRAAGLAEPLKMLMVAVTLLLLIACVNVSNLLLQRASSRQHEAAIRIAIGAGRARLARQLLLESLALALIGGLLGTVLAWMAIELLLPANLPPVTGSASRLRALGLVRLDGGALLFSFSVSLAAALVFGIGPAMQGTRASATAALGRAPRQGTRSTARMQWLLVGSEVALSFALLVVAGILIGSFRETSRRDLGYEPAGLIDLDVTLPPWKYPEQATKRVAFEQLREEVARVPEVEYVALSTGVPTSAGIYFGAVVPEGAPALEGTTVMHGADIDERYLATLGQPLLAGRGFGREDFAPSAHPVILGEAAARTFFPEGSAVGRRFRFDSDTAHTVIGVVRDIAINGIIAEPGPPIAYWPMKTVYSNTHLVIRSPDATPQTLTRLVELVRAREPDALVRVARGEVLEQATLERERFTMSLLTGFSAAALILAAIGLYGVLARTVTLRTHEIGIRVSLGADRRSIGRMIVGTGYRVTLAGLAAGALLAAGGLKLIGSQMFGLSEQRPIAYAGAAAVITAVALLAMWLPAMRAARIDPMEAIRE